MCNNSNWVRKQRYIFTTNPGSSKLSVIDLFQLVWHFWNYLEHILMCNLVFIVHLIYLDLATLGLLT